MKKFKTMVEYKVLGTKCDLWKMGKPITIKARNKMSAEKKAMERSTCYTHFTVIEEVK